MEKSSRQLIVEREDAHDYVLISLVAFGLTVIAVRLFLQLTGFPQLGNSTLHIAHLLWGGLLLFLAVLLVLIWDNPSFLTIAAALSGVGIGLFIDEVGKIITQSNDYFFPAAAPIIYGFFLVTVLVYVYVRRPDERDPRRAMVHALERLQDAIYGELDEREVEELKHALHFAQTAERQEIAAMARVLSRYVEAGNVPFRNYEPSLFSRASHAFTETGRRLGRARHRLLIVAGLLIIAVAAVLTLGALVWVAISPAATTEAFVADLAREAQQSDVGSVTAHVIRLGLEVAVGLVALASAALFLRGRDPLGILGALIAVGLSLTAVQLVTFYLDQFAAVIPSIFQFAFLIVVLSYRQWYLTEEEERPEISNA